MVAEILHLFHFEPSFIKGRLHLSNIKYLFCPLSLSLKLEEDPISVCWDIPILIFWGRFHLRFQHFKQYSILVWSPKLKLKIWGRYDQWLLRYCTFNICGRLTWKVIFISCNFNFWFGPLSLSLKFYEAPISCLLRYSTFNTFRSSSIGGHLHLRFLYNLVWSPKI